MISQTDPRDNTTAYQYDGDNDLIRITDPLNNQTVNTYDGQFHLTDVTDPLGHVTHTDYDSEHHPVRTTVWPTPGQPITIEESYYANGLLNTSKDGRSVVTTLTYDGHGNPATRQTAAAPAIRYSYDDIGRMTALTDQVGAQTGFAYDDRSLLLSRTDALLKTASLTYYDDGRLQTQTDRKGDTTSYTYTPSGKPDTVSYQDGAMVSYTYDQSDNLVQMQDSLGVSAYAYDALNRLTGVTDPNGFSMAYRYDAAGNVTQLTYPGGKTVSCTYDELNRLQTVTIDWLGKSATYSYDGAGRLTGLVQFNGTVALYGYDDANRLVDLENLTAPAGSVIAAYHFTLDANGNRTNIDQDVPLAPNLNALSVDFAYNNQRNRLLSAGGTDYAYDEEGQLIAGSTVAYVFDSAHRLVGIGGPDDEQYFYDGAGHRLEADRNGVVTRYIYDASGNLLAETDAGGAITRYYIYGAGGLLAMVTPAGQLYCYHFDATGHTVALTDSAKTIVNAYAYTPFGTLANQQESIAQPFKFVGRYGVMTEPNGWYYMRARYYDPQVGRFISEDPKGFDGGDVNLYAYVHDDPVNFVDPWGLDPFGNPGSYLGSAANSSANWSSFPGYKPQNPYPNFQKVSDWVTNPAHSSAIISSTIAGAKAGAETKNPYAGLIVGGAALAGECIGCHTALDIINKPEEKSRPCN